MQINEDVYLDPQQIPYYIMNDISDNLTQMVIRMKSTQEGRELLKRKTEERKRRKTKC